jgi:hypothetical protein
MARGFLTRRATNSTTRHHLRRASIQFWICWTRHRYPRLDRVDASEGKQYSSAVTPRRRPCRLGRRQTVVTVAVAVALAACDGATTEIADPAFCQQTYEFGNFGCGDVRGRILDAQGQPILGAYATVTSTSKSPLGNPFAASARTDSLGRYYIRVTYFLENPQGTEAWMHFAVPYCPALIVRDSVLITAPKANVGERAPLLELPDAHLTLPTLADRVAACG